MAASLSSPLRTCLTVGSRPAGERESDVTARLQASTPFLQTHRDRLTRIPRRSWSPPALQNWPSSQSCTVKAQAFVTNRVKAAREASTQQFLRFEDCLLLPAGGDRGPRGLVTFVGGAFLGAAPESCYSFLLRLLSEAGFLILAIPYQLTFDHVFAARFVHDRLQTCLARLAADPATLSRRQALIQQRCLGDGRMDDLPVYGLGHSNGGLILSLQASLCSGSGRLPDANVILSFNNRPASDCIPLFDQVAPTISSVAPALEQSPLGTMALALAGEATRAAFSGTMPLLPWVPRDALWPLLQIADQVAPVVQEVRGGTYEFIPPPAKTDDIIGSSYDVLRNLLVKFTVDSLDETDRLESLLRPRMDSSGGSLTVLELPGTHLTPTAQDVQWGVGNVYTPLDAIGQGLRAAALADMHRLASAVVDWFDASKGPSAL